MAKSIEELDYADTPLGELVLRRRSVASLGGAEIYEVKLDGEFLMSSLVNDAEIALADLALPLVTGSDLDVLVGGLGLGYTAEAALEADHVQSVTVVELLPKVVEWHEQSIVPLGPKLTGDSRCEFVLTDFFAMFDAHANLHADIELETYHAILLDIDHSPQCLLRQSHAQFYTASGMQSVGKRLHAGGVFALWSADPPDDELIACMKSAFAVVSVHERRFFNPLLNREDCNWIVVAQ